MARQLVISLVGDNSQLTKTLDDSTRKSETFGQRVGTVSRNIAPAVGAAGVAFTALGSTLDQANARLNTAVANSDTLSKVEIAAWADENQRAFQMSGTSIAEQNEALATAINSGADYSATKDMMSAADELSAAKNISLADAMDKVVKIMGGNGKRTLDEFGLGHLKGAEAVAALEGKLRGTSKALDETLSGRLEAGKTIVMDYAASIGTTLGPALTTLSGIMVGMPQIIGAMNTAVGALNASLALTALRAAAVAGALGVIALGIKEVADTSQKGIAVGVLGDSAVGRFFQKGLDVFHTGGIAGRDQLAVLQQGETVIPRGQSADGGGLTINVGGSVITDRDLGRIVAEAIRNNRRVGVT